jgi:hypothetical protein
MKIEDDQNFLDALFEAVGKTIILKEYLNVSISSLKFTLSLFDSSNGEIIIIII